MPGPVGEIGSPGEPGEMGEFFTKDEIAKIFAGILSSLTRQLSYLIRFIYAFIYRINGTIVVKIV